MSEQPYFRTDYYRPPHGTTVITPDQEQHDAAAASREATKEEMAYQRALGRPRVARPELPPIKAPVLPEDFAQRVADLDEAIYARGVPVNADKVVSLGRKRFAALLEADRKARSGQRIADLTSFASVQRGLHSFEASSVPRRTIIEQVAGTGKEREAVRQIRSFEDLWKATAQEREETVTDIYAFHDLFESLVFGHSMLECLSSDGRLRGRFFCAGKGAKIGYFDEWRSVLEGSFTSVKLVQPLFGLMAWLSDERTEPPDPVALAREFLGVRAPSNAQVKLMEALMSGFLLEYRDWALWEYVGRQTRAIPDMSRLSAWRAQLAKRHLGITSFQAEISAAFFKDVGFGGGYHRQFEPARHRAFLDRTVQELLDCLTVVFALAIEAAFSGSAIARFQGQVLCAGKAKRRAEISAHLAAAFPASTFPIVFEEVA
jgi:hypothetical protein